MITKTPNQMRMVAATRAMMTIRRCLKMAVKRAKKKTSVTMMKTARMR